MYITCLALYKCTVTICFTFIVCCDGDIHLGNRMKIGSATFTGRVDVCLGGKWGTVCDDNFSGVDASVVCGQLGFFRSSKSLAF